MAEFRADHFLQIPQPGKISGTHRGTQLHFHRTKVAVPGLYHQIHLPSGMRPEMGEPQVAGRPRHGLADFSHHKGLEDLT